MRHPSAASATTFKFLGRPAGVQKFQPSSLWRSRKFTAMAALESPAQDDAVTVPGSAQSLIPRPQKLFGRAFYESIGSPKVIVAPMVNQSEFVRISPNDSDFN
jgi:hypothetical protein